MVVCNFRSCAVVGASAVSASLKPRTGVAVSAVDVAAVGAVVTLDVAAVAVTVRYVAVVAVAVSGVLVVVKAVESR